MPRPLPTAFRAFTWLLLAAPLALSAVTAPAPAAVFNPETFTLANGMQVVVITNRRAPIISHWVWYKVGAADDPAGKSGIAHFFEHLMFKGTKTLAPGEFSKIIARNGGRDNAFTAQDYTAYFQKIARDRLELVMRMEADRMVNLILGDAEVLPERQVVLEERRSRTDNDPSSQFSEQMTAAQFLAHPYGRPIIGWAHEIAELDTADALAFYRRYYAPNNAILIVAGDVTAKQLRPLAEKYFGVIPARPVPPRMRPQEPPQLAARRVTMLSPRVREPSWSRSYLAPSQNRGETRHAYPLLVLTEIFGGGMTSRLFKSLVVEQKLATSAGTYYDDVNVDHSRFYISATPRIGTSLEDLEAAVDAEIKRLLEGGVTADEVRRAKARSHAEAIYARDSLYRAVRAFGSALTAGISVAEVEAWPERIDAVTVEQVNAAARHVLKARGSVTGILKPEKTS